MRTLAHTHTHKHASARERILPQMLFAPRVSHEGHQKKFAAKTSTEIKRQLYLKMRPLPSRSQTHFLFFSLRSQAKDDTLPIGTASRSGLRAGHSGLRAGQSWLNLLQAGLCRSHALALLVGLPGRERVDGAFRRFRINPDELLFGEARGDQSLRTSRRSSSSRSTMKEIGLVSVAVVFLSISFSIFTAVVCSFSLMRRSPGLTKWMWSRRIFFSWLY